MIVIGKAITRQKIKYSQAWAICYCSWSFDLSSWSFDLSSSRILICRFMSQSSRWCFRFASYSLFRAARDSSSHLAIRAFCCSKVFRLSTVLYKAWDFKKTDWQHPVTHRAKLVRYHQLLDKGKQQQKKDYLGILKAPLHVIGKLLHIVHRQQRIVKKLLTQLLLGRLWHRLKGY